MLKTDYKMIRILKDKEIRQSIKTKMFSLTDLLAAYNKSLPDNVPNKTLGNYISMSSTQDLINTLAIHEEIQADAVIKANTGKHGGTWAHGFIMLDFAMWLSVDFKIWALGVITDNLVDLRHQSGDSFKELCAAINTHLDPKGSDDYRNETLMVNQVALGTSRIDRDTLTKEQLDRLNKIQRADITLINQGVKGLRERHLKLEEFSSMLR